MCLVEAVLQFAVSLLESGFDVVPSGLRGAPRIVKLLGQPGCLIAQRLEFGFGLGFGRVA